MVADFTDCATLLGGDVCDANGRIGNGDDRVDDFIQRAIGCLRLSGRGLSMHDLSAHALH